MTNKINQQDIVQNLQKCPHFNTCSQNLCPLDIELSSRYGNKQDRCRFMREPKEVKIHGREFVSGGTVMPDAPLNFVPQANLKLLNQRSQQQAIKIGIFKPYKSPKA